MAFRMHRIGRFYFVSGVVGARHPIGCLEVLHIKRVGILLDALKPYIQGVEHPIGCYGEERLQIFVYPFIMIEIGMEYLSIKLLFASNRV